MKQIFTRRLIIYMITALLIAIIGLFAIRSVTTVQINTATAQSKLNDVKDKLSDNEENIQRLTDNLGSNSLAKARAFADILAVDPTLETDPARLEEIKNRLDVSEVHIIDENGIITASNIAEYIGFDMGSGEQSAAFLKIIDDPKMEIVQEPQENAAEHKLMQYIGVARTDGKGLVQVGVHPTVLENTLASTSVDIVLGEIDYGTSGYIYAIDPSTGNILAHKNRDLIGASAADAGFPAEYTGKGKAKIDGVSGYYVAEKCSDIVIGAFLPNSEYFSERNSSMGIITVIMLVIFVILIILINRLVDIKIISGINHIGDTVKKIAAGQIGTTLKEHSTPEFEQLSKDINKMSLNISSNLTNNERLITKQQKNMVHIREVCEDLERVASAIQSNSDLIFEGTGDQEQAVNNLRQVLERITDELNSNVNATLGITEEMNESVNKISLTSQQINDLKSSMDQIAEMSQSIEGIIDEINSIASQTNILSINANIEAARAGAAGKGFSVVASEVGSLAKKCAAAAKRTNNLITDTIAAVKNGQKATEQTAVIFGETVKNIEKANGDVRSIAEMVKNSADIVTEASDGMDRISDVVEKNVIISGDTKKASSDLTGVSTKLMQLVE